MPRPAQVSRRAIEVRRAHNLTIVDGEARVLVRVEPSLGRDGVSLAPTGLYGLDVAVLDDCGCVAEDEVYGAGDVVVTVKLSVGVSVEGVLVALDRALIDHGFVGTDAEGHGLVLLWA